jgi:probable rRNA maturation factor
MIEVEVFGARGVPELPSPQGIRRICERTAARVGIEEGHVAVEFVDAGRIAELNARHRNREGPTDVLSFPIDGVDPVPGGRTLDDGLSGSRSSAGAITRELGDIVICPKHTVDVREAVIHGMLHLLGMDHESDDGEMLALQHELLVAVDEG